MASQYSSAEIFGFMSDELQYRKYFEGESHDEFLEHAKKAIMVAINEDLTEKQRKYYTQYYLNGISIPEIASMECVNKSTVSRTLTRATIKIHKAMRYSAPRFLHSQPNTKNRRPTGRFRRYRE